MDIENHVSCTSQVSSLTVICENQEATMETIDAEENSTLEDEIHNCSNVLNL